VASCGDARQPSAVQTQCEAGVRMEPASPGMHTSDTMDFGYVISGTIWPELDDGQAEELRTGDVYVRNGTRHAWRNKSAQPCVILGVLIGAKREAA